MQALIARGKQRFEAEEFDAALADFERSLTYPENLQVGARYVETSAETRYWLGKTYAALGRIDETRDEWENGAAQRTTSDPPMPMISISKVQDTYVEKCRTALELLELAE